MDFSFTASSFVKKVFCILCDCYFLLVSVLLVANRNFNEDKIYYLPNKVYCLQKDKGMEGFRGPFVTSSLLFQVSISALSWKYRLWWSFVLALTSWIYQHMLSVAQPSLFHSVLLFDFFFCTFSNFPVCIYRWVKPLSLIAENIYILPLNSVFIWFLWFQYWFTALKYQQKHSLLAPLTTMKSCCSVTFLVHRNAYLLLSTAVPFLIKYNNDGWTSSNLPKRNVMLSFIFNLSLLLMKPSRGYKIPKLSLTRYQCLTSFYIYMYTFKKGKEKNQLPSLVFQFMNELNTISLLLGDFALVFSCALV